MLYVWGVKSFQTTIFVAQYSPRFITFKKDCEPNYQHGTIIQTGITCKKIPCYMRDSASRWLIVENAKIFKTFLNFPT